ncbi:MAG TPA: hypothetical protein VF254_09430 [Gammaproteobacteria bacterium]
MKARMELALLPAAMLEALHGERWRENVQAALAEVEACVGKVHAHIDALPSGAVEPLRVLSGTLRHLERHPPDDSSAAAVRLELTWHAARLGRALIQDVMHKLEAP